MAARSFIIVLSALVAPVAAEPPAKPDPLPTGTVITLGTRGGPMPTPDRAQSANLLAVDGGLFLIDAGDGATRRIAESGEDFRNIDKIFLTHLHSDHTNGLPTLLGAAWEFQRRDPIDVYGPSAVRLVAGAVAFLTPNVEIRASLRKGALADLVRAHDAEPGVVFQNAKVKVIAIENSHYNFAADHPARGKHRSFSYRFELANRTVVFTGDTGPSDAVTELARGADLLIAEVGDPDGMIELYKRNGSWQKKSPAEQAALRRQLVVEHLMPEDVGKLATRAGVKAVVLTHVVPTIDQSASHKQYIAKTKQHFTGSVAVAGDLMRY